tara:strand:- start:46 stop:1065 length:1020 start_codon:yes stop_codon:yes gene_type:complete
MAHIYKITNIINNKIYVGKTEHPPTKRWKEHLWSARNPTMAISHAIHKYGQENFKFEVIEECLTEYVNKKETYWIGKLDTFENGYNSTLGGDGNPGTKRERGAVHPDAKAVDQYDLKGKYLCTYDSMGEGAYASGVRDKKGAGNIIACIKGITFQAYGYRWALKGEPLKEISNRVLRKGKVYGIHLESGRKKMWKSQADAAEEIQGNRKANNSLTHALVRNDKPDTTKSHVKGWYLFRDKKVALGEWKPAEPHILTPEECSIAGRMSKGRPNPKLWKPIKGVHIETGEVVKFNHSGEAVKRLRSDTCKLSQNNLVRNIKHQKTGETHRHAGGYRWYYDT